MLRAKKISVWRSRYEITADERIIATWEGSMWKTGGTFELDGRRYEIRGNMWGSKYGMVADGGSVMASADRVGRKRWTVEAGGQVYTFERASIWRQDQVLHSEERPVGRIRRTSIWRSEATADLPGVPLPVQLFMLAVVLTMWDRQAATGSAGAVG